MDMDARCQNAAAAQTPDELLVQRCKRGCQQSFAELYQRHAGRLMPMLWRLGGGRLALAEDWLQDSFLLAWRKLDQLNEPARFGAWLKRLSINLALSDRRRVALVTDALVLEAQTMPEPPWPAADLDLERAVAALPRRARAVLVLFCLEGLSHAEIAAAMGIDPGTSKAQLHRARQILKESLS
ncbi:RNA polymerase sigma factor [Wenzhouxiangella limi]|uniref:Sigma-70 family RNA polymerase sigma factor n=1 Tax=Wenzhouxiangella limi TaxID=2707351 RepID=A0A845V1F6_9GAMM|nr:sigma-70 family RNA polymerase sigma factor [Wenzhouxiangella limi]NDY95096.1 sigma-70 family RNA polymerase sigma factor [Wenzhouxiangella limi]